MSLSYAGNSINLPVKVFEFLKLLIIHAEQTVTKEMAIEQVWLGNIEVGKRGAGNAIWALRKAFTELGLDHEVTFKTITKVGYQLLIKPQGIEAAIVTTSELPLATSSTTRRKKVVIVTLVILFISVLLSLLEVENQAVVNETKKVQRITSLEGIEEHPSVSPDGHYMAFLWRAHLKKNQIYIKDLTDDDAPLRLISKVANDQSSPSWSPDGQNIAYLNVDEQGQCSVHVLELITFIDKEITKNCVKSGYLNNLDWSKDGSKIAFSRSLGDRIAIFSYHVQSKQEIQLTKPNASEEDTLMRWHADNHTLAFVRSTELHAEIHSIIDDREQTLVKDKEVILALAWDRGGENLYFNSMEEGSFVIQKYNLNYKTLESFHQDNEIHSLSVNDTTDEVFYTRHVAQESIAVHSLEGGRLLENIQSSSRDMFGQVVPTTSNILFLSNRSGNWEVWLKQADKNIQLTQSKIHGLVSIPAVSPIFDQFVIAMRRPNAQHHSLHIVELPSGNQQKLLDIDGDVRNPSYSADGKRLYFSAKISGKWAIYRYTFISEKLEQVSEGNGKYAVEDDDGGIFFTKDNTRGIFHLSADRHETLITTKLSDLDWGSLFYKNKTLYYIKRTEKADFIIARDGSGSEVELMTLPPITIRNGMGISPGVNDSIIFTLQGINDSDIYKISIK
ncbi:winged helix-turn-helix domain-containing protein [Thalassotalea fonticola]|uniref:Winged helix-turn-helix domain-containing protein n=1 Tax=Thalassotalea fonticola TaxID=3065649 RepID=A0ABZ0GQ50_9GAMM|nr:winged helix-turn-helix domain-containing protein [Colwelliaceae bacterium S1-1]